MSDGFPNKPRILRGAFVEFGLSVPPLVVVFQFNPVQLTRNRGITYAVPASMAGANGLTLRDFHNKFPDLRDVQREQLVTVAEQTIGFDIRLDASDRLDEGDALTEQLGIGPQLATLEQMVTPKNESLIGGLANDIGRPLGFSFTRNSNPPLVLFVFGRKRVLPVNITALNITETEFSAGLDPVRASAAVNLTVIEGGNAPYKYTRAATEAMSVLNLARATDVANVVVPG
ncbi:hypothetical protein [Paractinoplanes durhamensis]|uniref:Uncharacterized protein n=1 Tax=Paractinoplanes durhamensis TaxID=113563 RepID=A0ABQ3Z766_9ACTN|nr:hypothetical protein [Actinoplanes durhamensis]GIE05670.1 hypothetical protein Adu01nite_70200 [Actinoplanes durhamensis]